MHKAFTIFVACLAVGLLSVPASALGQGSGVDVYDEDVPGGNGGNNAGGNQGSDDGGGTSTGVPTLTQGQEAALAEQGADGAAAANLANETGPGNAKGGDGAAGSGSGSGATEIDAAPSSNGGGSAFDDVIETVTGSDEGGMGLVLPIVIVLSLIAAIAAVAVRRSRQGQGT